jgi:transcriptional regulator with XRE-family HTH domain
MDARLTNRLRRWRASNGLTLEEVADLTGFSAAMFSRAERGERCFAPLAKVRVARALGVRVADLFEVEEPDEEHVLATIP